MKRAPDDLLGAHVSTQGGVALGPARGNAIGATAIQVFTKTPNQWREPVVRDADIAAFGASFAASGIRAVVSHDSYLINLASPDEALRGRRCGSGSSGKSGSRISSACTSTTPRAGSGPGSTATSGSAKARSGRSRSGASCGTRGSRR